METKTITVSTSTKEPLQKAWDYFTDPKHIVNWCFASDDWHCPKSENDLRTGGSFTSTMASKDGAMSFDFGGTYSEVIPLKRFAYEMGDGRKVSVDFEVLDGQTIITENFEPENTNPHEMQRGGWQAILDNFKKYIENN